MPLQPDYRYTTGAPGWGRTATADAAAFDAGLRAYMLRVFNWMASGLLLTGIVALWIGSSVEAQQLFWTVTRNAAGYRTIAPTLLGWAAMLSPYPVTPSWKICRSRKRNATPPACFTPRFAAPGPPSSGSDVRGGAAAAREWPRTIRHR